MNWKNHELIFMIFNKKTINQSAWAIMFMIFAKKHELLLMIFWKKTSTNLCNFELLLAFLFRNQTFQLLFSRLLQWLVQKTNASDIYVQLN